MCMKQRSEPVICQLLCEIPYNSSKRLINMKYLVSLAGICALLFSSACSQSPEKLIASGNRYHERKKYKEASILYQKAIAKEKTNAEAYYREGLNLLDDGNLVEATKYLRRTVDLKPSNTDAAAKLADIYLGAFATNPQKFKNFLTDVKELDGKILAADPNSFDGIRLQALTYLADNDREKALKSFEKANSIKPNAPELTGWYAETLSASQRSPEAEALVRKTLEANKKWGQGYDFLFLLYSRQNDKTKAEAVLKERSENDPSNAIALQNYANFLLVQNRFGEGEAVIKKALNKDFPSGHQIVGDYYLRAKKWDEATAEYQAGVTADSKNAMAYRQRMVTTYEAMGKRDEAFKLAKSLAKDNPKNELANESYAALLLQSGSKSELATAALELKAMAANIPADGAIHYQLARTYFLQGEPDKALTEALDAISNEIKKKPARPLVLTGSRTLAARIYADRGDNAKAIEQTEIVLTTEPKNTDARYLHDRGLVGIGQAARAQADLEALVQDAPGMNDAHLQLASIYLNQRNTDKANAEFEKVYKSNPPDNRGLLGMQAVKLAQGKGTEAVAVLQDLVQKNPTIPAYRQELANFQATAGAQVLKSDPASANKLFTQAADNYKELLKNTPGITDNWLRLGTLQRQLGQSTEALASFEQASKANPKDVNALLNRGMLLETLGRGSEASDLYNRVLGIDPDNPLALNNIAFMNAEQHTNLDQAMTFAERAKKRVPNSPDISDTLGFVYLQKNLNTEALRILKQVVQENPGNPTYHFHLAMALLKQGDRSGAKEEAQKALQSSSAQDQQDKIRTFMSQIG